MARDAGNGKYWSCRDFACVKLWPKTWPNHLHCHPDRTVLFALCFTHFTLTHLDLTTVKWLSPVTPLYSPHDTVWMTQKYPGLPGSHWWGLLQSRQQFHFDPDVAQWCQTVRRMEFFLLKFYNGLCSSSNNIKMLHWHWQGLFFILKLVILSACL